MEHTDKKLEVIKSLLQNYEEAYREGSWESFSKQKPTKDKRIEWFWVSGIAASVFLILLVVFLSHYNPHSKQIKLTGVKIKATQKGMAEKAPLVKHDETNLPITQIEEKPPGKLILTTVVARQDKPELNPENTVPAQATPKREQVNISRYSIYPSNEADNKKYTKKRK